MITPNGSLVQGVEVRCFTGLTNSYWIGETNEDGQYAFTFDEYGWYTVEPQRAKEDDVNTCVSQREFGVFSFQIDPTDSDRPC